MVKNLIKPKCIKEVSTPELMVCLLHSLSAICCILTGISRVVDGFVRLDEDVPRMKGHHHCPCLRVEALKLHLQIHKLVLGLLAIQIF